MKKKALGFMLAATMTVSVFAGCGGNQNEGNTNEKENVTNSNEDTQSVSAETNENGDETLTVWCWDPTFNIYAMEQAEKIYQKDHPDFKLDIQENIYNDIETKLITAATSGDNSTLPDIFLMQDCASYSTFCNNAKSAFVYICLHNFISPFLTFLQGVTFYLLPITH